MSKAFTREENDGPDIPDLPPLSFGACSRREELHHGRRRAEVARRTSALSRNHAAVAREFVRRSGCEAAIGQARPANHAARGKFAVGRNRRASGWTGRGRALRRYGDGAGKRRERSDLPDRWCGRDRYRPRLGQLAVADRESAVEQQARPARSLSKFPSGEETLEIVDIRYE